MAVLQLDPCSTLTEATAYRTWGHPSQGQGREPPTHLCGADILELLNTGIHCDGSLATAFLRDLLEQASLWSKDIHLLLVRKQGHQLPGSLIPLESLSE